MVYKSSVMLGGDGGKRQMGGSLKQKEKAKQNPWIKHVKAYAAKHKISYAEAISKSKSSYKKK
tara:strand:- start:1506 stop:1694 length:189 start_codon:yes stop_codon:yes gene_type:complete